MYVPFFYLIRLSMEVSYKYFWVDSILSPSLTKCIILFIRKTNIRDIDTN